MVRKIWYNSEPSETTHFMTPEEIRREFAKRLQKELSKKSWRQMDLLRAMLLRLPRDAKLTRGSINSYIRGKTLPGNNYLVAMADALGIEKEELMPKGSGNVEDKIPPVAVVDHGDNKCYLKISKIVPWPIALDILAILKKVEDL